MHRRGEEVEVLIVGGGGAGLVAALAAAEGGAQVVVLEKAKDVTFSNTARSGGMVMAAGTRFQKAAGIHETPEDLAKDIFARNHHQSDPEVTMALCRVAPVLVEWLVDRWGIQLEFVRDFKYPGHSQFRMHAPPSRTGRELIIQLWEAVKAHPRILFVPNTAVERLLTGSSGEVCGVVAVTQGPEEIPAKRVILACDGFGGNRELVRRYIPEMADAYYFGGVGNTGEAILWGLELGADLAFMDAYQAHATVAYPHGTLVTWAVIVHGGIIVNRAGQRFANEDIGYSSFARHVLEQEERLAYVILDGRILELTQGFSELRESVEAGAIRGPFETLEALAESLHIDATGLTETVVQYNRAMRGEGIDPLGRKEGHPLGSPYFGVQVTGALFHTQGGLRVNAHAQVLRQGRPIPGLYAAGGSAAGISGHGADGYLSGNGLLCALGLGYIAGHHASRIMAGEEFPATAR
ncbi:MAG: FAD-dependent oxidoreductase [Armatimonadota bacterium]|nr:FAD-dependent oxidoreductase [Armatimonadota bacterium]